MSLCRYIDTGVDERHAGRMTADPTLLLGVLAVLALAVVVLLVHAVRAPLGRRTVDRFARRQHLVVDTANGGHVVRALALVLRWRRLGLVTWFAVAALVSVTRGELTVDFVAMFLGWFAGAVVAEWLAAGLPAGSGPRRATLRARSLGTYVTALDRVLLFAVLGLTAAVAAVAFVGAVATGRAGTWAVWVAGTLAAAAALAVTARRVVRRPQPTDDRSLLAADDALRAHSLTVLCGCAIAASGVPLGRLADLAAGVLPEGAWSGGTSDGVGALALVVCVALGWFVADRSASVRARGAAGRAAVPAPATPRGVA